MFNQFDRAAFARSQQHAREIQGGEGRLVIGRFGEEAEKGKISVLSSKRDEAGKRDGARAMILVG